MLARRTAGEGNSLARESRGRLPTRSSTRQSRRRGRSHRRGLYRGAAADPFSNWGPVQGGSDIHTAPVLRQNPRPANTQRHCSRCYGRAAVELAKCAGGGRGCSTDGCIDSNQRPRGPRHVRHRRTSHQPDPAGEEDRCVGQPSGSMLSRPRQAVSIDFGPRQPVHALRPASPRHAPRLPRTGAIPYVYIGPAVFAPPNCSLRSQPYYDPRLGDNVWDYYFVQPSGYRLGDSTAGGRPVRSVQVRRDARHAQRCVLKRLGCSAGPGSDSSR